MSWVSYLPAVNAVLNTISFCLLGAGYWFIRQRNIPAHRRAMLAAVTSSALFLTSYLVYHYHVGSVKFQGQGLSRPIYFAILITHVILAAGMVPFILATLYRALTGQFERHRRIARGTFPVWMYVSVTGVVIYLMLYHLFAPAV